ncbi:hypothetical protein CORT_0C03290 [Candida orthopsilosis Co 90-125]|uniref:DUF155 domain-containing protein n=1 Tax=Candida orthopsilosis (strain 90-125) TaxID=1136231 RepID=H8X3R6_CANO9|nr:hypothetical protein CORT_0C03290 [Candida orthopsilosis Co 90-125]CCG25704.1 hypothetical protein CORT_0C03290 [Candida orthopsilosis Co 90-125]
MMLLPTRVLSRFCYFKRSSIPLARWFSTQFPQLRSKNAPKKRIGAQKLRRTDPAFQNESTSYILSLLDKNKENQTSKTLESYLSIVTSVTVGDAINFDKVIDAIRPEYKYDVVVPDEVINIEVASRNLMVLSNGTFVGWDFTEDEIISKLLPKLEGAVESKFDDFESEELDWIALTHLPKEPLNNGNSYLHGEILVVQGNNPSKRLLDMAAFAIGLSRSTRLSILETQLDEFLTLTRKNSEILSSGKRITSTEQELLRITGRLFLLRGKLNLYSELIETPDLYWSEPILEKIYNNVSKILDINSRISIMNRKLDYATEEQRAFLSVLNEKKSTRLEWIIILLIMVEVIFEIHHFYEKYEDKKEKERGGR